MFDTVVIATDGSSSAERAVAAALDLAGRFDATVHALYVVDSGEVAGSPEAVREEFEQALATTGGRALTFVREAAVAEGEDPEITTDESDSRGNERAESASHEETIVTAIREGDPATEICQYARDVDADVISTGTRGRHGQHAFVLGSVAEGVVRRSDVPVLTVRQLEGEANPDRDLH